MNKGDNFQHIYIPNLTCEIVELTKRGAKVLQTDSKKKKQTTAFYDTQDFHYSPYTHISRTIAFWDKIN